MALSIELACFIFVQFDMGSFNHLLKCTKAEWNTIGQKGNCLGLRTI